MVFVVIGVVVTTELSFQLVFSSLHGVDTFSTVVCSVAVNRVSVVVCLNPVTAATCTATFCSVTDAFNTTSKAAIASCNEVATADRSVGFVTSEETFTNDNTNSAIVEPFLQQKMHLSVSIVVVYCHNSSG